MKSDPRAESLKAFQEVLSIHVYSLSPHPQRDLALLADLTRSVAEYTVKEEEPSVSAKKYGSIINPHVRRRTRKGPAPVAAPPKAQPVAAKPKAETPFAKASVEPKEKASNPGSVASKIKKEGDDASKESTPAPSSKPTPSLQRGGSGGIMQSFAKAANMPKKPKKEEDTAMALSDDGEADDDDIPAPKKVKEEDESLRKTKKEREEALRKMMEDDDDDDDDDEPEEKDDPADQEMEEAPEPVPELETKVEAKEEPSEVISSAEGGRRRGRRKVMQKKRILDDQGYMGKRSSGRSHEHCCRKLLANFLK